MAVSHLISEEGYLSTSYDPDCEYADGEVIERCMGEFDHAGLQGVLLIRLSQVAKQLGLYVFPELRVQVAPRQYRVPDIVVTNRKGRGRILSEPPFLCVELLSPEDRASRVEANIDEYLNFGVPHVWLIDPGNRRAWSYMRRQRTEATNVLVTGDPMIELPLAELFADLDEQVESE